MAPVKYILFDCDNTLVLSESLAFEACAELANEILAKYNIDKRYTGPELLRSFVGYNFRGMLNELCKQYKIEIPEPQLTTYVDQEMGKVIEKLEEKAESCEGVMPVLERLHKEGKYGMAIVSSSALPRVMASIEKTKQIQFFDSNKVYSAASSLDPPTSKPNPAIYLHACEKLGVKPEECIAIEDSRSGATAAKNAKIPLMGYVGPYYEEGEEKVKQVEKMLYDECGAVVVMHHWKDFDQCFKKMQDA